MAPREKMRRRAAISATGPFLLGDRIPLFCSSENYPTRVRGPFAVALSSVRVPAKKGSPQGARYSCRFWAHRSHTSSSVPLIFHSPTPSELPQNTHRTAIHAPPFFGVGLSDSHNRPSASSSSRHGSSLPCPRVILPAASFKASRHRFSARFRFDLRHEVGSLLYASRCRRLISSRCVALYRASLSALLIVLLRTP